MPGGSREEEDASEALCAACEEAKGTLDHQLNWLQQTDEKAVRILRANILLIGLILTALSLSLRSKAIAVDQFLNLYTIFGGLALILSSMGAAITYISSSFEAGVGDSDLEATLEDEPDLKTLYRELAQGYSEWISYNRYVLGYNSILITMTLIAVVNAISFLSVGATVGILQMSFTKISKISFVILSIVMALISVLIYKSEKFVLWYFRTRDGD